MAQRLFCYFNFPAQVDSSILNKIISGRNLSNVDAQQWYAYKKIL